MTTNDTRTLTELQAEAAELYPMPLDGDRIENACAYAARHAHIAALAARDAEPATVTAEQIDDAAREFLRYTETASPDERSSATSWDRARRIARMILLAADVRIEGDPA